VQNQVSYSHGLQRLGGVTVGKTIFTCVYIENIFSRTIQPEKSKFTWKLPVIVQNQVCLNHGLKGGWGLLLGAAKILKITFTIVYIGKI
jgi:hypothetical protein